MRETFFFTCFLAVSTARALLLLHEVLAATYCQDYLYLLHFYFVRLPVRAGAKKNGALHQHWVCASAYVEARSRRSALLPEPRQSGGGHYLLLLLFACLSSCSAVLLFAAAAAYLSQFLLVCSVARSEGGACYQRQVRYHGIR